RCWAGPTGSAARRRRAGTRSSVLLFRDGALHGTGRYARDPNAGGDVVDHHGPGGHVGPGADCTTLTDDRPDPDVGPGLDPDPAGQLRPGPDERMLADVAIVIDASGGVDDRVRPDRCVEAD